MFLFYASKNTTFSDSHYLNVIYSKDLFLFKKIVEETDAIFKLDFLKNFITFRF